MAHEVETMAYANATPWHKLGVKVSGDLSPEEMCHKAGLDWTVALRPVYHELPHAFAEIEGHYALVRSTDKAVMTVVGDRWNPTQNVDAFRFFDKFVKAGGAKMETAGSLKGGRLIWGLCDLGNSFTLRGNDQVRGYLLLLSPHILGRSHIARVTPVRVVCANTLAMALSGSAAIELRFGHQQPFDPSVAADAMGLVRENFSEFSRNAKILQKLNLSDEDVMAILAPVYQPNVELEELVSEEVDPSRTIRSILDSYQNAPGAQPGNGWGLLNAVTHHADHKAGRDEDSRLASAWIGVEAGRKMKIFNSLLELANA